MKTRTNYKNQKVISYRHSRRYPNAAPSRYFLDRLSNWVLSLVTACGTIAIFIFLFSMA